MSKTKNSYTSEFKQQAVRLSTTGKTSISQVARELGIHNQLLRRWIKEHIANLELGRPSFTGRGNIALSEQEKRIKDLERENAVLKEEREIVLA